MTENIKEWMASSEAGTVNETAELDTNACKAPTEGMEERKVVPIDAKIEIAIEPSRMLAKIMMIAPQHGGLPVSQEGIEQALADKQITAGIKTMFVSRLAQNPVYRTPIRIAEGQEAVPGKDGYIVCTFDSNKNLTPVEDEDELVDYRNLDLIRNVKKDELLCTIYPPVHGENGYDVYGNVVEGKIGREAPDPCGNNTYLSEDRTELYAACDGNVTLSRGKVTVGRVITVDTVDLSTGNLLYVGSIVVNGDVKSGFTVSGSEGVIVYGTVEDAKVISAHDIVVRQGINGSNSKIIAGGIVRTGFIESATVQAKGDIYADVCLHADLSSEGQVVLSGARGALIGGCCRAAESVTAKEIGNNSDIPTVIEVFGAGYMQKDLDGHRKKLEENTQTIEQLKTLQAQLASKPQVSEEKRDQLTKTQEKLEQDNAKLTEKIVALQEKIEALKPREVSAKQVIHGNVLIEIEGVTLKNLDDKEHCVAYRKLDKVVFRRME